MSPFILIIFSLALLSSCQADLIDDFCSKTMNPYTCNLIIRANPKSKGADARGLAAIAVEDAQQFTKDSVGVAKSVVRSGIEVILIACIENFNDAITALDSCKPLIDKRDKSSVAALRSKAAAVLRDVSNCGRGFIGGQKEPQKLKDATDKAYVFAQLLAVIAKSF